MLNKVILIGKIEDNQQTQTEKGVVIKISLTTSKAWRDRQDYQLRERTERHIVIVTGKKRVKYAKNLSVGSVVYVVGQKKTISHIAGVTKEGVEIKSYQCEIEAAEIKGVC